MQQLPLEGKKKYYTWIDDIDYPFLSQFHWFSSSSHGVNYAEMYVSAKNNSLLPVAFRQKTRIKMHRLIVAATDTQTVCHTNGKGLDNQRRNLVLVDRGVSSLNDFYPSLSIERLTVRQQEKWEHFLECYPCLFTENFIVDSLAHIAEALQCIPRNLFRDLEILSRRFNYHLAFQPMKKGRVRYHVPTLEEREQLSKGGRTNHLYVKIFVI